MDNIQFIVHCWLDVEGVLGVSKKPFMNKLRSAQWVKKRCNLFKTFTESSLLNQSFQDFRIFLFCGQKFKAITENFPFDKKVERVYDYGKSRYLNEINTDYISIMRIDSDDMFHKDLMSEVRLNVRLTDKREANVYRNVIQWNIYHKFISDFFIPVSPFTSHTFPKKIYKDWQQFLKEQFCDYKSSPNVFKSRKVCIIRHQANVTWTRINKDPKTQYYLTEEKRKRDNFIANRGKMVSILKDFGVSEELVK